MNKKITVPIFPLVGAMLLPTGNLPLNIFEERYLSMVDFALSKNKLIGMAQTKESSNEIYKVGCIGRITSFDETSDNRYLINLHGLYKFRAIKELGSDKKFRIFEVKSEGNKGDFFKINKDHINKNFFIKKVVKYFDCIGAKPSIDVLNKYDNISLVITIAMLCPFSPIEKQMLLETYQSDGLASKLITLFDYYSNNNNNSLN